MGGPSSSPASRGGRVGKGVPLHTSRGAKIPTCSHRLGRKDRTWRTSRHTRSWAGRKKKKKKKHFSRRKFPLPLLPQPPPFIQKRPKLQREPVQRYGPRPDSLSLLLFKHKKKIKKPSKKFENSQKTHATQISPLYKHSTPHNTHIIRVCFSPSSRTISARPIFACGRLCLQTSRPYVYSSSSALFPVLAEPSMLRPLTADSLFYC